MKSLFARILIWFLATSAVTFGVMVVTTALSLNARPRGWLPPFARALPFTLTEARHAYETGGREALGRLLSRARQVYQAEVVLTDGEGHDLLTGEDRHALVERASQNPSLFTRVTLCRLVPGRSSEDGRYWL